MTEVRLDRPTRTVLTVIAVLLAIIATRLWTWHPPITSEAMAQIPDSGEQRLKMLMAQDETNRLLRQIVTILRTEPIQVELAGTDKTKDGGPRLLVPRPPTAPAPPAPPNEAP